MIRPLLLASALALLAACATTGGHGGHAPSQHVGQTLEAPILGGGEHSIIGRAHLTEGPKGVLIKLDFNEGALSPGWHGVHFHEKGTCDDAGYQASGSHVGHGEGIHGLLNPTGPEPGDLPSIFAPADGAFGAELYSPFLTLAPSAPGRTTVLDADGTALIIHANRDDHVSQPIGGAGARVACATFSAG